MFLVGGTAFSGTTLLALLLNQGDVVCLDEPDFHKPEQGHRGIPVLESLFPDVGFPPRPSRPLEHEEAFDLMRECARAIHPKILGMKTCDTDFVSFAKIFRAAGYPVIGMIRDIRDALVRPLPDWVTEETLNHAFRNVWTNLNLADAWIRYEDLVNRPESSIRAISAALARELVVVRSWDPSDVHPGMLKLERHDLLTCGFISTARVGIWRTSKKTFLARTHETARMMGYAP